MHRFIPVNIGDPRPRNINPVLVRKGRYWSYMPSRGPDGPPGKDPTLTRGDALVND